MIRLVLLSLMLSLVGCVTYSDIPSDIIYVYPSDYRGERQNSTAKESISIKESTAVEEKITVYSGESLARPKENNNTALPEYHVAQQGETLYSIANLYGLDYQSLAKLNNLKENKVIVGQKLYLARQISPIAPNEENCTGDYKVKEGDTLYSIAQKHTTSVETITKLNKLQSTNIYVGQVLKLDCVMVALPPPSSKKATKLPEPTNQKPVKCTSSEWIMPVVSEDYLEDKGKNGLALAIFANAGEPVQASSSGKVIYTGKFSGLDNMVLIEHNDSLIFAYGWLEKIYVQEGQNVNICDKIGSIGVNEKYGRPALFFQIRDKGSSVNVIDFMKNNK